MSDLNKTLVCAIVGFLKKELNNGKLPEESTEGLGIGIQCLESAYDIGESSESSAGNTYDLLAIFEKYIAQQGNCNDNVDKNEQKVVAEILKNEGNNHMDKHNFKEAIASYTKAIELNPRNPVYYCNRAAALNKFGDSDTAIEDCRIALKYDPLYHKAYARLGVAYTAKNKLKEARDSFKKAVQLQPDNENYKTYLKNAEDGLRNGPINSSINIEINGANFPLGNIENELTNVINMATSMLGNRHS